MGMVMANLLSKPFINNFFQDLEPVQWSNFIWFKHHVTRFSIFTWMAFRNGIKTADVLISRGISVAPECIFCKDERETLNHLLFGCNFTYHILIHTPPRMKCMLLRPNLWQVFNSIDEGDMDSNTKSFCYLLLSAIVYFIWKARNDRSFGNILECQTTVISMIKRAVRYKTFKRKCFQHLQHWLE
ncbi:uncharacterized protein LOC110110121 [Dendrobium catenatum]|uniref:uncharacterized protein LOC110110121 n=1 Tax=Dendrobium catenatum TaxID=906689 RepID=UPI0010A0543B|nr:uncharacterized protein LOC110110121 [Dendrobium catenatum]